MDEPVSASRKASMIARNEGIVASFMAGESMKEIGNRLGLSREYIRQVIAKHGMTAAQGGFAHQVALKREAKRKQKEERQAQLKSKFLEQWGTPRGAVSANPEVLAYLGFRWNVKRRGITNTLTFFQWKDIWAKSGILGRPGQGQYGLTRRDLTRGFDAENAVVRSMQDISRETVARTRAAGKLGGSKTHCKRGYEFTAENTYVVPGRNNRQCLTCRRIAQRERRRTFRKNKMQIDANNKLKG